MTLAPVSLAVMARAPEKGSVKTRLQTAFSQDLVLALYEAMLRDTLELVSGVAQALHRVAVHWASTPGTIPTGWAREFNTFDHRLQKGRDLGERLFNALLELGGGGPVVAIGCDSPTLPPEFLLRATEWLGAGQTDGAATERSPDLVLGPSDDGGYYLVGMRSVDRRLFEDIDWGSAEVLQQSLRRARECGLTCRLLPDWYDVDSPEDLARVLEPDAASQWQARHLRAWLAAQEKK